ncbi:MULTISPECIES: type II toxin-antitoxin system RelE/ParE family toxin [Methylobacterium]|uniref:Type II toxin-antitoxin system RelE/ParE family toxin n=1 Tax=Methylobacterium thuringiense TaxID=1003091 RepID=A0ABQ4TPL1_9HYPH|nr:MULTISPECIES: type II toxin-antitoxin system RelE/ParE family toxin [Methylobacterium]TXN19403.1 type II toxin-antitoxin system RelE/ParE family toxin [Methylobacterium sp. WL9]GJE55778.1 hypothetical protein EKPJFOCH_2273 [Methylobacterium thuringiense]
MHRLGVEFQPEARADLADIFHTVLLVSQHNATAENFIRRIITRCERIGDAPRSGRSRDDLKPGLRMVPFEHSAVIAYTIDETRVLITNIFHGGRDYEALYREHDDTD